MHLYKNFLKMEIRFLQNERALVMKDFLVIADLHIGYEKTLEERGYKIPSMRKDFIERIKKLQKENKSRKLIILGDVKHTVPVATWDEKYEIPNFFKEMSGLFDRIIVIKGNHDGNIERMVHEKKVEIVPELILEDFAFTHGHRYPTEKAMECRTLVMGHIHPTFKIRDRTGTMHNYPCWVMGKIKKKKLEKYKNIKCENVLIVPSFNQLTTGYKGLSGPLAKAIKREAIYLLDLTKVM